MNIPKSPSLQLLRKLHHHQFKGLNDVSISSEDDDWGSYRTVVHRHSGYFSAHTSRCSSVLSLTFDWEEDKRELNLAQVLKMGNDNRPICQLNGVLLMTGMQEEAEQTDLTKAPESQPEDNESKESQASSFEADLVSDPAERSLTTLPEGSLFAGSVNVDSENGETEIKLPLTREQRELAKRIFVKNISESTTKRSLWNFFGNFAKVSDIYLVTDYKTRKSRGRAFIQFSTAEDAAKILAMDRSDLVLHGRCLYVDAAKPVQQKRSFVQQPNVNKDLKIGRDTSVSPLLCETSVHINRLPSELLEHIFSFLNIKERIRVERVCTKWRHLSISVPWSINYLSFQNLFSMFNVLTDAKLRSILRRCGLSLTSLDMCDCCHSLTYRALEIIGEYCPNLENVNFTTLPLTNIGLKIFSTKCVKVKKAIFSNSAYGEKGLWWVLKNCTDLQHLDVTGNSRIKGLCFHIINKQIKSLIVKNCPKISTKGFLELRRCTCIRELVLDDCSLVDEAILIFLLQQFKQTLKKLSLNGRFPKLGSHEIVFTELENIEDLSLADCSIINDATMQLVSTNCFQLQKLNISKTSVSNVGIGALTSCPNLSDLNASHLTRLNDDGVMQLAMGGKITRLTVRGSDQLSVNVLVVLVEHCKMLQYLDVSNCTQITDILVTELENIFEREDRSISLKVIAGGTLITRFEQSPRLTFEDVNLCPFHLRPYDRLFPTGFSSDDDMYLSYEEDDSDKEFDLSPDDFNERLALYEGKT